ncbi:hypothetical protein D3C85_1729810 [compost metagenome]
MVDGGNLRAEPISEQLPAQADTEHRLSLAQQVAKPDLLLLQPTWAIHPYRIEWSSQQHVGIVVSVRRQLP